MRRCALPLAALVLLIVVLSGCGGGAVGPVTPTALVALPLGNAGAAGTNYRWGDIAGNLYGSAYVAGFSYDAPVVRVSFDDLSDGTLAGTLTATGLKPNFAYQLKLEGQPTVDAWANEQIGYLGRWWSPQDGNVTDRYYRINKSRQAILGYLLFDFFITDGNGCATRQFRVDSSYHVLWNWAQSTAPISKAGPTQVWAPAYNAAAYASAADFRTGSQSLFGEIESGRPLPGKALLPAGTYHCALVITEESFHNYYPGGGSWAAAMWNQSLAFTVNPPAPVHDVAITAISTASRIAAPRNTTVSVTVANQGSVGEKAVAVTLSDGGVLVGSATISSLAAGASTNVALTWKPATSGSHVLTATVAALPDEVDTADNVATRTVQVR